MEVVRTSSVATAATRLRRAQEAFEKAAQVREEAVLAARAEGVGWQAIGRLLGMPTSAVYRHYAALAASLGLGRRWHGRDDSHPVRKQS